MQEIKTLRDSLFAPSFVLTLQNCRGVEVAREWIVEQSNPALYDWIHEFMNTYCILGTPERGVI